VRQVARVRQVAQNLLAAAADHRAEGRPARSGPG
jgi:hypothetical protein